MPRDENLRIRYDRLRDGCEAFGTLTGLRCGIQFVYPTFRPTWTCAAGLGCKYFWELSTCLLLKITLG